MYIAPPDIIDPELIEGYCFSGIGKELKDVNNYSFEPNLMEYADKLDSNDTKKIIEKIRRDRLVTIDSNGAQNAIWFSNIILFLNSEASLSPVTVNLSQAYGSTDRNTFPISSYRKASNQSCRSSLKPATGSTYISAEEFPTSHRLSA